MATATSLTAARMLEIEKASVVSARRENGELILTTHGGTDINVGDVTGAQGPAGPDGASRYTWLKYADSPTSGMSDEPLNKNYIGLAYNKTTAIESNDYADYNWTLIRGPEGVQGVPGPAGDDGEPTYVWIKYATDETGSGMSDSPTNRDYIGFAYNKTTPIESINPEDYTWSLIKGPKGDKGDTGAQGIPGAPGADGMPVYTWLKYATTPTTGMSDDPTGKDYIGLAYNKGTATESTNYSDYQWSLIRGPQGNQGVPGTPGADGTPRYVWIKYAATIVGDAMSDDPTGKDYIGLAYNKTTAIESTNAADYTWSLYKGPAGADGDDGRGITSSDITYQASMSGVTVPTGTWLTSIPVLSAGQYLWTRTQTNYSAAPFTVMSYSVGQMGQTGATGAAGTTITAAVVRYQLSSSGVTPPTGTWLTDPPAGSPGQWFWTRTVTSYSSGGDTVAYSVAMLGATGPTGATGSAGADGADGRGITSSEIRYQSSASGTIIPTGTWLTDPPVVGPSQFLWTRTRTFYNLAPTEVDSYSVGMMGATGATGNTGIQGPPGTTYYTWLKYADSPTTGMSDIPTGKTYIGLAMNKTVATESSDYNDYTWSLIKGEQGIQGNPGADGQITYTWIKYGTSSAGAGISDDPTAKTYIGIAYNKTTIVESTNPADYTWSLIQGAAGAAGESVTGQTTQYQLSSSGTVIPSGTWLSSPPAGSPGQYMWTRISFTYTTLPTSYAYSVALLGNTGPAGANAPVITMIATAQGLRSPSGGGVTTPATTTVTGTATNTTISVWEYAVDGGVFSASVPAGVSRAGNVVTITGATMTATTIAVRMADANGVAQAVTVVKVFDGAIGPAGNTGRGISSTDITYQAGSSGTSVPVGSWLTDPPAVSPGQYLWTKTVFTYSSGSPATTTHYSVGSMGTKIDTVTVTYQLSNSGTVTPSGTWLASLPDQTDALPFLWTRTVMTYLGGPSTTTSYNVSRRGVGVTNVQMIYQPFTPKVWNGFEKISNTPTEIRRNLTHCPDGRSVGIETQLRWGWNQSARIETDQNLMPLPYLSTYVRHTVGTGSVGAGRGMDWYINMDVAPAIKPGPQVVSGKTYLIAYYTRASKTISNSIKYRVHDGTTWLIGGQTLNTVNVGTAWVLRYALFTPSVSGYLSVRNDIDATGWASTDYLDQTGLLLCESSILISWFSGDYSPDNDLEPSWVGSVGDSESILTGLGSSPDHSKSNSYGISSIQWAKNGSKSYRLIPSNSQNSSYVYRTLLDYGLENTKSYTIAATMKLFSSQIGSLNALARTISLDQTALVSNQAPNLSGEHALILKFTIDGTNITTGAKLILYNGASTGNGDVWFDDLIIVEGDIYANLANWAEVMPSYSDGMVLFRSEKVTFSDGSISYSPPKIEPLWDSLSIAKSAQEDATQALTILDDHSLTLYGDDTQAVGLVFRMDTLENDIGSDPQTPLGALVQSIGRTASGKNITIRSTDGAINPQDYQAGDQWYQYDTNRNIINFWIHDGNDWIETKLNGVIFGSVDAGVITSGYINAERIQINSIPQDKINNLQDALSDLASISGDNPVSQAVRDLMSSIEIGSGVIKIKTPGAITSRMELRSNRLGFWQDDVETAYISDSKLVIRNAEIATTIGDSLVFAAHDVFKGGTGDLAGKVTVFRSI